MGKRILSALLGIVLMCALCVSAFGAQNHMSNFQKDAVYQNNFRDVSNGTWYAPYVRLSFEYGLMNGTDGAFRPGGTVSLAEAVVIAARIHDTYTDGDSQIRPSSAGAWYQPYVDYAVAQGIFPEDAFTDYGKTATRAEVAFIFSGALPAAELYSINSVKEIPDMEMSRYYYPALLLYNAGVLTGSGPQGAFRPDASITRAEIAAMTARMIVPDERAKFVLLTSQDMGDVLPGLMVYMPGTKTDGTVNSENGRYRCEVFSQESPSLSADSIVTDLTKKEGKERLAAQLALRGYTMDIPSVRPFDAAFGTVPVYAYEFWAEDSDGKPRFCYGYAFVQDGNFCSVSFLTYRDSTEFRSVIAAPTLNGARFTK